MKYVLKAGALFVLLGLFVGAVAPSQIIGYCCGAPPPFCPIVCPK